MKTVKKISLISVLAFLLSSFFLSAVLFANAATVKDVEVHLMCPCEDKCGKMLSNCTCKFSDEMRLTIAGKLKDGLTKDAILAFYIEKYGEKILSSPEKKGFNLVAWITPFIVLAAGGIAIRWIIVDWVKKKKEKNTSIEQDTQGASGNVDSKYKDKLKKELDDFDT